MQSPAEELESFANIVSENWEFRDGYIIRHVTAGKFYSESRCSGSAQFEDLEPLASNFQKLWDQALLRSDHHDHLFDCRRQLGLVDLFSGCGGFSLGFSLAAEAIGAHVSHHAAVDTDDAALAVYGQNFQPKGTIHESVTELVDFRIGTRGNRIDFSYSPEITHEALAAWKNKVTAVIGGPPCQGHSNFNNRSRRSDPRNSLYLTLPAAAVALQAPLLLIENVPDVTKDKSEVVKRAINVLESEGYKVDQQVISALDLGLPQTRRRHILVASRRSQPDLLNAVKALSRNQRNVEWAIGDLKISEDPSDLFNTPADLSDENKSRIDHLFDEDIYNLPNHVRPDCHKDGHSYPSVYGRLAWDQPAGTITTGFLSPGRGRFIHPSERRGLTPHEAARLQGFPDWFQFTDGNGRCLRRKEYSKLIGDAVPPILGYVGGLCALATLSEDDLRW